MPALRTLLLDLDDTLYPAGNGLWEAIGDRINQFIIEKVGVPPAEASALRERYFREYGTSLNGLRIHHAVDPHEYLAFVHDVPLESFLEPDPHLRSALQRLALTPTIFTNANLQHARRVLSRPGVEDLVGQIIDIEALDWRNKPDPQAYRRALVLCHEADTSATVVVDDQPRNLATASALGMKTILVGGAGPSGDPDAWIPTVHTLPDILPELGESRRS